jgi:sugar phosphate isomerase/epimerase
MNNRRDFLKKLALGATYIPLSGYFTSCTSNSANTNIMETEIPELRISLAQWSIHRALEEGTLKAADFAAIAKKYDISAVEYVNGFYRDHANDEAYWNTLKKSADDNGVKSLLIMVDEEGDLANPDTTARAKAVENHFKWVNAANLVGCHSIRVNAFGEGSKEETQKAMADAMSKLGEYAAPLNINILIENHGLHSSDGKWVSEIIKQVNMPNCGTLPDFGNWCLSAKWGTTQIACDEVYNRYEGVNDLLPFAKGVSAKSYEFNDTGEETRIDYSRMLQLVKDSGFGGYVGIEFEGFNMTEHDGIVATKKLLENTWKKITTEA